MMKNSSTVTLKKHELCQTSLTFVGGYVLLLLHQCPKAATKMHWQVPESLVPMTLRSNRWMMLQWEEEWKCSCRVKQCGGIVPWPQQTFTEDNINYLLWKRYYFQEGNIIFKMLWPGIQVRTVKWWLVTVQSFVVYFCPKAHEQFEDSSQSCQEICVCQLLCRMPHSDFFFFFLVCVLCFVLWFVLSPEQVKDDKGKAPKEEMKSVWDRKKGVPEQKAQNGEREFPASKLKPTENAFG